MDKRKIITIVISAVVVLVIGFTVGFFIGKDTAQNISEEITTTAAEETTEAEKNSETEKTTDEATTVATVYVPINEIVYATTGVNVRSGADISSTVIGGLKKGERIQRVAVGDNGWSKVLYNGKNAYVFSQYLTKNSPDSNGVDMCGISNTDAKNLTDLLEYLFFYGMESYDSKSEDAFEKAIGIIHGAPYYNFSELVSGIYRIHYEGSEVFPSGDENDLTDPRGYWKQFRYIEAEFVDFILENMFNVKPDHEYIFYTEDWYSGVGDGTYVYYEDGYYYSDAGDGGDGCGPEVTVKKVEILPDGKYQVTVHYRVVSRGINNEIETVADGGDIIVVAEMKNIDGNSLWSFYEIKP